MPKGVKIPVCIQAEKNSLAQYTPGDGEKAKYPKAGYNRSRSGGGAAHKERYGKLSFHFLNQHALIAILGNLAGNVIFAKTLWSHGVYMERLLLENPCLCLHARRASRHFSKIFDEYFRPEGLNTNQYSLLSCISKLPEPSITDISRLLCMEQTTVTRNIEMLCKLGLVYKTDHADDTRKKLIRLTEVGEQKLRHAHDAWEKAQNAMKEQIGEKDFKMIIKLLVNAVSSTK